MLVDIKKKVIGTTTQSGVICLLNSRFVMISGWMTPFSSSGSKNIFVFYKKKNILTVLIFYCRNTKHYSNNIQFECCLNQNAVE